MVEQATWATGESKSTRRRAGSKEAGAAGVASSSQAKKAKN